MKPVYIVVLAGGSDERLWLLSAPAYFKRLPPFIENTTQLNITLERAVLLGCSSSSGYPRNRRDEEGVYEPSF